MGLSKEEIIGNIQRLYSERKKKARLLATAVEMRQERDEALPAFDDLQKANEDAKLAASKLNEQRDADSTWQERNHHVTEARADLSTTDDALSEMLVLWQTKTKQKHVHADPNESASVDHEIKTTAKIGKKASANVSMFDQEDGSE